MKLKKIQPTLKRNNFFIFNNIIILIINKFIILPAGKHTAYKFGEFENSKGLITPTLIVLATFYPYFGKIYSKLKVYQCNFTKKIKFIIPL